MNDMKIMEAKTYDASRLAWIPAIVMSFLVTTSVCLFLFVLLPQIPGLENVWLMLTMFFGLILLNAFGVYATLLFLDLPRTRLELSDDGVVLYSAGYRIYTPWENIARVGWTRFSRSFPGFIRLKEPAVVATISFEEGKKSRQAVIEKWRWWMRVRQLKSDARYTHFLRIPAILLSAKGEEGRNYLVFSPLFAPAV